MKILRIQFQNLNSLPRGDVDLEHGPLAQAGIFAITGPTGSGKSTVLDAITLALYGRAARYGSERNPHNMMSRHTGECRAEVLFEVPRGRFSARWELHRARNKPGGNLQQPQRSVMDEHGAVLAQKINDADHIIEELTGLDYDRFLRSVLLAQGEFAQFLKADKDSRAELLESLTGTQIYSDLGTLAFEECTNRERALEQKEGDLGRILLLGEEERAARGADIERLTGEIDTLSRERDELANRIQLGRRLAELALSEAELSRRQSALASEKIAVAPELDRLARHRLAEPFFADLQTLDSLIERSKSESVAFDNARETLARTRRQLASGLHAASMLGGDLVCAADTAVLNARETVEALSRKRVSADDWLALHAADKQLDAALTGLIERLATLANARGKHADAAQESKTIAGERQSAIERLAALDTVLQQSTTQESAAADLAKAATATLNALLDGRSLEAIQAQLTLLDQRRTALAGLRQALEKRDAADDQIRMLTSETAVCTQRRDEARAEQKRFQTEAQRCEERLELTREKIDLLKRIAKLEEQRPLLKPGEACPLCGALEHPFADGDARPSAGLRDAEKALIAARAASTTATRSAQEAAETRARAEQTLSETEKRLENARREHAACGERHAALANTLKVATADELAGAFADNSKTQDTLTALISSIRNAERAAGKAEVEHVKAQGSIATTREKIAGEQKIVIAMEERIRRTGALLAESQRQIEQLTAELAADLHPFGVAVPDAGAEPGTGKALEKRRQKWQEQDASRQRLDREIQQGAVQIGELERQVAELRSETNRLTGSAPGDRTDPSDRTDGSAAPPDLDESARLRRRWMTLDDAAFALTEFRTALALAVAAADERQKALREVDAALCRHSEDLRRRLASTPDLPFSEAVSLRAARLEETEAQRLAQLQSGLEQQIADVDTRLDHVRGQCLQLHEAGAPEPAEIPPLETERKTRDDLLISATENRATLRNELVRDDECRKAREAQRVLLAGERGRLAVWERLRHFIGSHDGAKFRQFAQGLSLDVLLRHANRHLRRLNDRYQLQRVPGGELLLEIVDLHQAGTTRPMLSLSGGESFLASLALALGLSDLAGRNVRIDSLFIDEGFGSLDADTLDTAVAALDTLRLNNKTVGVISHVELLKERIPVQIRVEKLAGGISVLHLPECDPGFQPQTS